MAPQCQFRDQGSVVLSSHAGQCCSSCLTKDPRSYLDCWFTNNIDSRHAFVILATLLYLTKIRSFRSFEMINIITVSSSNLVSLKMMMKLPILPCAAKLELVLSTAPSWMSFIKQDRTRNFCCFLVYVGLCF